MVSTRERRGAERMGIGLFTLDMAQHNVRKSNVGVASRGAFRKTLGIELNVAVHSGCLQVNKFNRAAFQLNLMHLNEIRI